MYNDARAAREAALIANIAPAESGAHGRSSALAKLLYLLDRNHDGVRHAVHQADWIAGKLSGRHGVSDENNALKLGYDPIARAWPGWIERLGVRRDLLPEVLVPGTRFAEIDPEIVASRELVQGVASRATVNAVVAGPGGRVQIELGRLLRAADPWKAIRAVSVQRVVSARADELVEVEGSQLAGDPDRRRGLVPGHRAAGGANELIHSPPQLVLQRGDSPDRRITRHRFTITLANMSHSPDRTVLAWILTRTPNKTNTYWINTRERAGDDRSDRASGP